MQTEESRAQSLDGHGAREEQFWDYFWTICKVLTIGVCYSCKFTFVLRQPEPHRRLVRSTMNITNLKLFKNAKNGKMYPVWVTYLFCLHKSFV